MFSALTDAVNEVVERVNVRMMLQSPILEYLVHRLVHAVTSGVQHATDALRGPAENVTDALAEASVSVSVKYGFRTLRGAVQAWRLMV